MSGNSLASLLAWMKNESRMMKWGLVVALERRKANMIILQEYIRRFSDNSYLPPITGDIDITENRRKELVHDFLMDVPVLSFENADINDSKAMLTLSVMGGSQLTLEKESVGWKAYKLHEIDPMEGPKLHLDLRLNEVPGVVEEDGRVRLDLTKSDNFRLTFGTAQHEQRVGGDFFKDLFNELPEEQRVYTLGVIQRGASPLMEPKSFELRTQASGAEAHDPQSSSYGDGAILAFVRTMVRLGGDFPGESYKYLIPDDPGKNYSATVLFDRRRVAGMVLLDEIGSLFESEFDYEFDADGELIKALTKSGALVIPEIKGSDKLLGVEIKWTTSEMVAPIVDPYVLAVSVSRDKLTIDWNSATDTHLIMFADAHEPLERDLAISMTMHAEYEFVEGDDGKVVLKRTVFQFTPTVVSIETEGESEFWAAVILLFLGVALYPLYLGAMVMLSIGSAFKDQFQAETSINDYLQEVIKLNFGQAIQGEEVYAPHDIGFFGRISPAQTSFVINPLEPLLLKGSTQKFTTDPVIPGVQWKVESLVEGADDPGTIDKDSGMYQAPASISGRFARVRVSATAPDTGFFSNALVTVVANELTVNPLIQVCNVKNTVALSAGALDKGQLQWSIKNPVDGESGEVRPSDEPEGDHIYENGPPVAGKTYVIDEIEVKNPRTGSTRSVHVLALKKDPMLAIRIDNTDVQNGKVQLTALFDGEPEPETKWKIMLGPGSIDSEGVYRAEAAATERFALIVAEWLNGNRKFEGHLILPLPLVEFPHWLEVLSQ